MTGSIARKKISRDNHIRLGQIVLADDLDQRAIKFYQSGNPSEPLLIDFASARYIDIPTLFNLISLFVSRRDSGSVTYLGLPSTRSVRDFLNVWRFPEALALAIDRSFVDLVVPDDRHLIGEPQITYRGHGTAIDALEYDPDWKEGFPGRRNFFEFNSHVIQENGEAVSALDRQPVVQVRAIPRREGTHWNGRLIQEVLLTHLPGDRPKDDIARIAIYESMSNAILHPRARIVQTASRFERVPKKDPATNEDSAAPTALKKIGTLRICVWDDGDSITSTLKPLIDEGRPIRSFRLPAYMYDNIAVQVREFGDGYRPIETYDQSQDPPPGSQDHVVLLASTYPGVTRSTCTATGRVDPFPTCTSTSPSANPIDSATGMGLYALMRTVLDTYRGSLVIRSSQSVLKLEPSHDAYSEKFHSRYKAKVTTMPAEYPPFRGNLLTIQIPVRE